MLYVTVCHHHRITERMLLGSNQDRTAEERDEPCPSNIPPPPLLTRNAVDAGHAYQVHELFVVEYSTGAQIILFGWALYWAGHSNSTAVSCWHADAQWGRIKIKREVKQRSPVDQCDQCGARNTIETRCVSTSPTSPVRDAAAESHTLAPHGSTAISATSSS